MPKVAILNNRTACAINNNGVFVTPKSVYVTLGGGLGDVFYVYSRGENGWGYIKSLKQVFPAIHVKALCSTHNPQTIEFIKYNPYIDEYHEFGWVNDAKPLFEKNSNGSRRLNRQSKLIKELTFSKPKVHMTEEDNIIVNDIISAGDYVMIHPFAGEPGRKCLPTEEYIPLIDSIIEEKNLNVVVTGGTYKRKNFRLSEDKDEVFEYEREGLFNLVGKSNARVSFVLASRQKHFIGNWSAYSCASWLNNKMTTVTVHNGNVDPLKKKLRKGQRWHNAKCNIVMTKGPSHNPNNTDYDIVREKILKTIT